MHPLIFHISHLALTADALVVASGLVAGLQISSSIGARLGLASDRIWNLALGALAVQFVGERMLVVLCNFQDFRAHPAWMLALRTVRDERYFFTAAALSLVYGSLYIAAWRLPWRRVLDALAPGAGLTLACMSLGAFAAGTSPGRATSGLLGVIYTSQIASRMAHVPLGIPLLPVALYAAVFHLLLAAAARRVALCTEPGFAAAFWLSTAGLATVLLGHFRYLRPGELLVFDAFTQRQATGVAGFIAGCALYLAEAPAVAPGRRPEPPLG